MTVYGYWLTQGDQAPVKVRWRAAWVGSYNVADPQGQVFTIPEDRFVEDDTAREYFDHG